MSVILILAFNKYMQSNPFQFDNVNEIKFHCCLTFSLCYIGAIFTLLIGKFTSLRLHDPSNLLLPVSS